MENPTINNLSKMRWNDTRIDRFTQYLDTKTFDDDLSRHQMNTIKDIVEKDILKLDKDKKLIYIPKNVMILRENEWDKSLKEIYDDITLGLGKGIKAFHYSVNTKYLIPRKAVEIWLKQQGDYQINKEPRVKKDDAKIIALFPNSLFMSDVMKFPKYSQYNNAPDGEPSIGLFNVMDVFSKKVWSFSISQENGEVSRAIIKKLFRELGTRPKRFITDGGATFQDKWKYFLQMDYDGDPKDLTTGEINKGKLNPLTRPIYGSPFSPQSQAQIERVQKTIRQKIRAIVIKEGVKGKFNYVKHLDDIVENYNDSKHSSSGFTPNELYNSSQLNYTGKALLKEILPIINDNSTQDDKILYVAIKEAKRVLDSPITNDNSQQTRIQKGDYVRISMKAYSNRVREIYKNGFDKKNLNVLYTPLVYRVKRYKRRPTDKQRGEFILENIDGSQFIPFKGLSFASSGKKSFFESELQKIDYDNTTKPSINNFIDADYMNFITNDVEYSNQVSKAKEKSQQVKLRLKQKEKDDINPDVVLQRKQNDLIEKKEQQKEVKKINKISESKRRAQTALKHKPRKQTNPKQATIRIEKKEKSSNVKKKGGNIEKGGKSVTKRKVKRASPPTNDYARVYTNKRATQQGSGIVLRQLLEYQMKLQERFKAIIDEI